MNVDVLSEVIIDRAKSDVAVYAANPDNAPEWYVNIKSVEWKTPRPLSVGSRIAFVAHFLGRRMAYTYEVVEFVAGERFTMRTTEGPFPMETTYTWEALGERTRMTLRNRGTPAGFSKWLAPFMSGAMRRANRKDLSQLKRLLEGHEPKGAAGHT
jgi:polyketide cyclase/dehydrase/lipid transport protein